MNMNVQSTLPISSSPEDAAAFAAGIVRLMSDRAHLMRGRPTPTAATTATWAGDMEQWAADLAKAHELMRGPR